MTTEALSSRRARMVEVQLRQRGIRDERVLAAMEKVPREQFVAPEFQTEAYADAPLPIGGGQTISQPFMVATMLEALELQPADRVLEVGAGTGYQAALLGEIAAEVWTHRASRWVGRQGTADSEATRLSQRARGSWRR